MIDFSGKYNNRISNYGLGFQWNGISTPKKIVTVSDNFNFYGQIGMFQTWSAKALPPSGFKGKYRTLLGVGI